MCCFFFVNEDNRSFFVDRVLIFLGECCQVILNIDLMIHLMRNFCDMNQRFVGISEIVVLRF